MELLAKLLGGYERVKIMRFFLHQTETQIDASSLSQKVKGRLPNVRKELMSLASLGFLEKRKGKAPVIVGKKGETKIKEAVLFKLNSAFPHNEALKELLFDFKNIDKKEIANRFKQVGRIKLFVLAGVFVESDKLRVDVFIVGESLKKTMADKVLDGLSAELGRTLTSSLMDTEEFEYRRKMYDKFVGDVFVLDHEIIIDKLKGNL